MKAVNVDDVLKILHKYGEYTFVTDEKRYSSMVDEIANLNALDQESFKPMVEIDLYSVIKQKYVERDVLDKIRAEFEEHVGINQNLNVDRARAICWCLDVIDKYMAESEEK